MFKSSNILKDRANISPSNPLSKMKFVYVDIALRFYEVNEDYEYTEEE